MQGDCATLSTAVDGWYDLIESPDMEVYQIAIRKRMTSAIEPFFIVAYLMDPFFMGKIYFCLNHLSILIINRQQFNIKCIIVFKN